MAPDCHGLPEIDVGIAQPRGKFPRSRRIRRQLEFAQVQAVGKRVTIPHFSLLIAPSADAAVCPARLGIRASRRIGPAVVRNRAKRLVREAFRATADLWSPGIWLVVTVRSALGPMKLADVVQEWLGVEKLLRRRVAEAIRRPARPETLAQDD